jgi:hypothetical protein
LNRFINNNDKFTVYLSDLIFTKLKFTNYPIDEIITHINEIEILDYDTLIDIMKKDIHSFRTLDNEIYYI